MLGIAKIFLLVTCTAVLTALPCLSRKIMRTKNSKVCNRHGTYENGICTCNEGFIGEYCECDVNLLDGHTCKMSSTSELCDSHGECTCGVCSCFPVSIMDPSQRYTGQYCECNDYSCDKYEGQLCGGSERGRCSCGVCICKPGYIGDTCDCAESDESCRASNGRICNGKGRCECGRCICDSDFRGVTCEDYPVGSSPICNNRGTYDDGVCTCYEGFTGQYCDCDTSLLSEDACKMSSTSEICEGHGECACGVCNCSPVSNQDPTKKYRGQYCECNDHSCDYFNGQLCGGPERGHCSCGVCVCKPGYTGYACECPTSVESCRATNGEICNGKGMCECGQCRCDRDSYYTGVTCEDCPTCPGRCEQVKPCVQCYAFQSGELNGEECEDRCDFIQIIYYAEEDDEWRLCRMLDDDGCTMYYTYHYHTRAVRVQQIKTC